jgi:cadmium resistance protein CadD (predicted permease)
VVVRLSHCVWYGILLRVSGWGLTQCQYVVRQVCLGMLGVMPVLDVGLWYVLLVVGWVEVA